MFLSVVCNVGVNYMKSLSPECQEVRKPLVTIASLKVLVLLVVSRTVGVVCPPVTVQLQAGSGSVFPSSQQCYETEDLPRTEGKTEERKDDMMNHGNLDESKIPAFPQQICQAEKPQKERRSSEGQPSK